jgi:DNA-directed RNA polymerase subunit RPC12/RpoP
MPETSQEFWARVKREDEEKKQSGEKCLMCGEYILCLRPPGYSQRCWKCKELDGADAVRDNRYVRCPKCRHSWNPFDGDAYWENDFFQEGEHDVCCPACEHRFEVTTNVSYSFDSPVLIADEVEEEEAEEVADVGREPPGT